MSWTILHTSDITVTDGDLFPMPRAAVLTIQEDDMGRQRAYVTDGVGSTKVDVAWAWHQVNS